MLAYAGGCDNAVQLWNLQSNQVRQVAQHEGPVRHLHYIKEMDLLVTASWDKTLKYWDLRQAAAVNTLNLPQRVYALSVSHPLLVVGMANRQLHVGWPYWLTETGVQAGPSCMHARQLVGPACKCDCSSCRSEGACTVLNASVAVLSSILPDGHS